MNKKIILYIVLGILVVLIGWWLIERRAAVSPTLQESTADMSPRDAQLQQQLNAGAGDTGENDFKELDAEINSL